MVKESVVDLGALVGLEDREDQVGQVGQTALEAREDLGDLEDLEDQVDLVAGKPRPADQGFLGGRGNLMRLSTFIPLRNLSMEEGDQTRINERTDQQ